MLLGVVQHRPCLCEPEQQQRRSCNSAGCRSPYAHKLEECGLRLSREQWQARPMAMRLELLQVPAGPEFARRAQASGARRDGRAGEPASLQVSDVASALDCDDAAAPAWLAAAGLFALYAIAKIRKSPPAQASAPRSACGPLAEGGIERTS